jgi:hypothetical protein
LELRCVYLSQMKIQILINLQDFPQASRACKILIDESSRNCTKFWADSSYHSALYVSRKVGPEEYHLRVMIICII